MARDGFFTGLDIGTNSIKVLVAELRNGELNVIGVSNAKSKGVKDGIIVDIEAAATAIKSAISQAEEKAGISIKSVNVGLPGNLLQVEPTQGMIPVTSDTKEITDQDVENVVKSALTKSMTPDREVITFIPEEFIVDGFQGIRDPRGMMGVRLEMRGLLYTGPRTILHNLRKTVERSGVQVENIIISPLALVRSVLNEGEREFGATVIDMGAGQTTVATIRNQELQFTNIGEVEPVEVTESYLAEIISARIKHIFEQIKQELERRHLLDLPGGIVLIGGNAILPGIVELAQEVFGVGVKLYVPNQVGIRNPAFAHVISLSEFAGQLTEVNLLAQRAVKGEDTLRHQPINFGGMIQRVTQVAQPTPIQPVQNTEVEQSASTNVVAPKEDKVSSQNKPKIADRFRGLIGSMFDE